MSSFEDVFIEDLITCPNEEFGSGLKTRLYYAPSDFFFRTPVPIVGDDYSTERIVPERITMKKNKSLRYIDILIDETELKESSTGGVGRKKIKSSLSIFILGFRTNVLGFISRCINVRMIFFISDANGKLWQIGSVRNPADIDSAESTTGKKYEDNSGAAININCNSKVYLYPFDLSNFSIPGDFNTDFNKDFF